ncbi:MAG TPA: sensor domain-containing diguanylate cyclase [Dissulfurispiraceae bacterium]|nr:sensor domain-containing diguanylate cyclase [Dissulfurispiraceae bacterium]
MNIAKKIMLGYGVLLIVVFAHLIYSLSILGQMDRINEAISRVDNPIVVKADQLPENLFGQELYASRLAILKDKDSYELLQLKINEFSQLINEMKSVNNPPDSFRELVSKCTAFLLELQSFYGTMASAAALTDEQRNSIAQRQKELIEMARSISGAVRYDQRSKTELSAEIGRMAYRELLVVGVGSVLVAVGITLLFARYISRAVGQLKMSTRMISESRFDEVKFLDSGDEFGEVSKSIAEMAGKIQHLEKLYIATNPLSLLPGGLAIDDTIGTRLEAGIPTAICVIDLDNFKIFNDRYGYAKGNDVIKETAAIITDTVKELGAADDFIGHIGGDDFIVVTAPDKYEPICRAIIKRFDERITSFYDPADREKGVIVAKNRQGAEVVYPLMTVSIAVVSDRNGTIKKLSILSRRAAELKEYAKSMTGSVFVVDQRQYNAEEEL